VSFRILLIRNTRKWRPSIYGNRHVVPQPTRVPFNSDPWPKRSIVLVWDSGEEQGLHDRYHRPVDVAQFLDRSTSR
jgi:hypothetical protein